MKQEDLCQLGEVILQDTFQVWEPKRSQLLAQLSRHKPRERRVFLFETCLLLAKEREREQIKEKDRDKDRASERTDRAEAIREAALASQTCGAARTRYVLKSKIYVCSIPQSHTKSILCIHEILYFAH